MNKAAPPASPNTKCFIKIVILYIIADLRAPSRPTKKQNNFYF